MDDATKAAIESQLKKLATSLAPKITFRSMYGGTVIELKQDDPKSRIGGIFTYTDYLSLELSKGTSIDDPKNILEGNGKLRRHVKLHEVSDVKNKDCANFMKQAFSLA